jgi:putative transposase
MFCTTTKPSSLWRFDLVRRSFLQQPGLPFADALSEERLEQALIDEDISFGDEQPDEVVYTPAITLWAFLSQMLFTGAQRSCVAAVARVSCCGRASGRRFAIATPARTAARDTS